MNVFTNGADWYIANDLDGVKIAFVRQNNYASVNDLDDSMDFDDDEWRVLDDNEVVSMIDTTGDWRDAVSEVADICIPADARITISARAKEWAASAYCPTFLCSTEW